MKAAWGGLEEGVASRAQLVAGIDSFYNSGGMRGMSHPVLAVGRRGLATARGTKSVEGIVKTDGSTEGMGGRHPPKGIRGGSSGQGWRWKAPSLRLR